MARGSKMDYVVITNVDSVVRSGANAVQRNSKMISNLEPLGHVCVTRSR